MKSPRTFFKTVTAPADGSAPKSFSIGKAIGAFFVFACVVIVVAYVGLALFGIGTKLNASWSEIKFAYQYPQVVKPVRTNYETTVTKADKESLSKQVAVQKAEIKALQQKVVDMQPTPTPTVIPNRYGR